MPKFFSVFVFMLMFFASFGQIQFLKLSKEELFKEAAKQNKYIFVDVFTDWCGPCIRMDKMVFTDSVVAAMYNKSFLSYKADAERASGIEWRVKFDIQFFPSYLFFHSDGRLICKTGSGMSKELFISETKRALACNGEKELYLQWAMEAENIILNTKRGKKLAEADTLLRKSIGRQAYLYNLYLGAKLAAMQNDFNRAAELSALAMPYLEKLKKLISQNKYSSKPIPDFLTVIENELLAYMKAPEK